MPEEDPRRRELIDKVARLVAAAHAGDYRSVFAAYDGDGDGKIGTPELVRLLADAGVGSRLTRTAWAAAVVCELDADGDDLISLAEFERVLKPPAGG